jgi:hypothetical protein
MLLQEHALKQPSVAKAVRYGRGKDSEQVRAYSAHKQILQ